MRIALGQIDSDTDVARNLGLIRAGVARAAASGAEIAFFPEYAMYEKKTVDASFADAAEPIDGAFGRAVASTASEYGIAVVAGMVEAASGGGRPFNTLVAFDATGDLVGRYRKLHLYDSYGFQESAWIARPDSPEPAVFSLAGERVGLMTCNDLRYPGLAADLVGVGAELLAVCSSWVPGAHKTEQWRVLARARAIENLCFVVGVSQTPPVSIGTSLVVDPTGVVVAELDLAPELACVDIVMTAVSRARSRAAGSG